jgi:PKD repeat protein
VEEDSTVVFEGMGTDTPSDEDALSFAWEIDGRRFRSDRAEVSFGQAGRHEARFTVTDGDGDEGSAWVNITVVNVPPDVVATLEPRDLLTGEPVTFTGQGVDTPSDRRSLVFEWSFGDGGSSANANGTHVYEAAGDYTVRLTVRDDDGETEARTFHVAVRDRPVVPPGPSDGDGGGASAALVASVATVVILMTTIVMYLILLRRRDEA